jgi:hypothetical protein
MALPEPIQAAAPPPKAPRTRTACRKSLSPDLPRWVRRTTSVRLPDKRVKSRVPKLRRLLSKPNAWTLSAEIRRALREHLKRTTDERTTQ